MMEQDAIANASVAMITTTSSVTDSATTTTSAASSSSAAASAPRIPYIIPGAPPTLPRCPYLQECPRYLAGDLWHITRFDHDENGSGTVAEGKEDANSNAPHCPFGPQCHRDSVEHRQQYYHPPLHFIANPPVLTPLPKPFFDAGRPNVWDGPEDPCPYPLALREIFMCRIMGDIKNKHGWWKKVFDQEITEKWIREGCEKSARLTERSMRYCIQELQYEATMRRDGTIQSTAIDGVYQAEGMISEELRQSLLNGVKEQLEDVSEEEKDWHPGTHKQVLDLVHPSMYCYVIGQTRRTEKEFLWEHTLNMMGFGEPEDVSAAVPAVPAEAKSQSNDSAGLTTEETNAETYERENQALLDDPQTIPSLTTEEEVKVDDVKEEEDGTVDKDGVVEEKKDENGEDITALLTDTPSSTKDYSRSTRYAWLPAEFLINPDSSVLISSYIPGLHPIRHEPIYSDLEQIFHRFIPMFERVLTDLKNPREDRIAGDDYRWKRKKKVKKTKDEGEEEKEKKGEEEEGKKDDTDSTVMQDVTKNADEEKSDESKEEEEEKESASNEDNDNTSDISECAEDILCLEPEDRELILPDAPEVFIPPFIARENHVTLIGRRLQVIVKLANIILTPENPHYEGGSWHVEGMKNESIVASGIYYYESENITTSRLGFRRACCEPAYVQNDTEGVWGAFGLSHEGELNQSLGSVITKKGKMICFPNTLQHRVQPFELIDPSKEGVRKILVFFLVDPAIRVISTATVPPQTAAWSDRTMCGYHQLLMTNTSLIDPLVDIIREYIGSGTMTRQEAEKHREELMKERKYFVQENSEKVFAREFSLCEH